MDLYKRNVEFLRNYFVSVYGTLTNEESKFKSKVTPIDSNIKVENDYKICMLHSTYSVERETAEMFSAVDQDAEYIVVFGMGLWHCRNHIFDTYKNLRHLIIVEPDLNIFKEALHKIDLPYLAESRVDTTLLVNRSEKEAIAFIYGILKMKDMIKMDLACSLSYRSLYTGYFETIYQGITAQFRNSLINYATTDHLLYKWVKNIMMNHKQKAIPVSKLTNHFEEIPAIIVSAGPSLNYNMHYLKEVKNNAVILAVGSAIKILDSNGIVPHFRVAIDPNENERKIFDGIETDNSILIFADTLCHGILEKYEGGKIRMALDTGSLDKYIFRALYDELFLIASGFSIANVALDLVLKLGFKKVIFMGQDLSYTEGSLYAKGSWTQEENIDFEKEGYIKTVNVSGETVYTSKTFLGMRDLLENIIRVNPGAVYINATERGLNIAGTVDKHFDKVMEEDLYENRNVDELINDFILQNQIDDVNWKQRLDNLNLGEKIEELSTINAHTTKKLMKLKKQSVRDTKINKLKRDLNEIEAYAAKQLESSEFYQVVVKQALRVKFHALRRKYQNKGSGEKEVFENNFERFLREATEIKIYLDFLSNVMSDQ